MAKYTMTLRDVINYTNREVVESWFKEYDIYNYLTLDEINTIEKRGTWNKDKLARKIVNYYLMREIGFETIALFRQYVVISMERIMESKLPLIYSASISYDPLVNVDYIEEYSRNTDNKGKTNGTSVNNSSGLTVNSDTPQGEISKDNILQGKYASSTGAGESTSSVNDNASSESNTKEKWSRSMKGNAGISATAQKMIKQYRDNIIAIDDEIIKELNDLFMGVY